MTKTKTFFQALPLLVTLLLLSPSLAQAHLMGGVGLTSGLTHPLFGMDHLLAMVAVGVVAIQLGGSALWKVPATFLAGMLGGGLLAMMGVQLPMVETGIALSVLMLGVAIALSKKIPASWAMFCISLFALFHGHAHGSEMSTMAQSVLYATGFLLSTAVLHASGVLMGHYAQKTQFTMGMLRYAGVAMMMVGLTFLF